jgi:hypothetical protein
VRKCVDAASVASAACAESAPLRSHHSGRPCRSSAWLATASAAPHRTAATVAAALQAAEQGDGLARAGGARAALRRRHETYRLGELAELCEGAAVAGRVGGTHPLTRGQERQGPQLAYAEGKHLLLRCAARGSLAWPRLVCVPASSRLAALSGAAPSQQLRAFQDTYRDGYNGRYGGASRSVRPRAATPSVHSANAEREPARAALPLSGCGARRRSAPCRTSQSAAPLSACRSQSYARSRW